MPASQNHGFLFEQRITAEVERRLGPATAVAQALGVEPTARFDLQAWRDPTGAGVPTSLKLAKRARNGRVRVDLADARRTASLAELPAVRLLVGIYDQKGDTKVVDEVREYVLPGELWGEAAGEAPAAMIGRFHEGLKEGTVAEARASARDWKKKMTQHYPGILRWAAKVDSTQRRLQCSVYLDELEALVSEFDAATLTVYGRSTTAHAAQTGALLWEAPGLALPMALPSPPRARKKKPTSASRDGAQA